MLNKMKNNLATILIIVLLIVLATIGITQYVKDKERLKEDYIETYEKCQNNLLDEIICSYHSEPYKNRDTVSTFGYIIFIQDSISTLQILAPLLIMIAAGWNFHKYLRKGYLKNALTRIEYKEVIKELYKKAFKSTLIFPIFLFLILFISFIISGNFNYKYGINLYRFTAFDIGYYQHFPLFFIVYCCNFILHGIFWINIIIYNVKHNKNIVIAIIVSYIEYFMIFIIFNLVIAETFFVGTKYYLYFLLSIIWTYESVSWIGVTLVSLALATISTLIVYLAYRDKEKVLEVISK